MHRYEISQVRLRFKSNTQKKKRKKKSDAKLMQTRDRVWSIVVVSSVANVVVSCLLCRQQEHAGLNPTESMTRALISDDNIARQSALGPVQLGYVLPLLVTPSILIVLDPRNLKSRTSPGIARPIIDSSVWNYLYGDDARESWISLNCAFKHLGIRLHSHYWSQNRIVYLYLCSSSLIID